MQLKPFASTMTKFWKKPLSELKTKEGFSPVSSLNYSGESKVFANIEEIRAAGEYPNEDKIVKFVNAAKKAAAKQKAMAAAVAAAGLVEPTAENDPQIRLQRAFETFMSNFPTEEARKDEANIAMGRDMASKFLGIAWADEDEDSDE